MLKTLMAILLLQIMHAQAESLRDRLANRIQEKQQAEWVQEEADAKLALPVDVRVISDVAYGGHGLQKLDVYLPKHSVKQAPIVLMVHGGAWRYGDKASASVVLNKVRRWVSRGCVFVSVNYRLLPEANPLQQSEDVIKALMHVQRHASEWGGDGDKVILMGHSAGAHLVDVVSAVPEKAMAMGAKRWLGTVSLDTATMDVVRLMQEKHYRFYDDAFGKEFEFWKSVSPQHLLAVAVPPMLLVCSSTRPDHPCSNAKAFSAHAATLNVDVQIVEQALTHKEINQRLGAPGAYTDTVEKFMSERDVSFARLLQQVRK